MRKNKTVVIILSILFVIALIGNFALWWNGAFNELDIKNITSYENNGYTLTFQQLGEPQWSFWTNLHKVAS